MVGHAQNVTPFKESIVVEATGLMLPPSAGGDIHHHTADNYILIDPGSISFINLNNGDDFCEDFWIDCQESGITEDNMDIT